jgi:4-aminobutyrate aminotransferase-like enzyme
MGDVRGVGLFIGIELVLDRDTRAPAHREARELVNRLKDRGILLGSDGPFNNVVKIKPPMVITREDADMFVRVLDDCLTDMEASG